MHIYMEWCNQRLELTFASLMRLAWPWLVSKSSVGGLSALSSSPSPLTVKQGR